MVTLRFTLKVRVTLRFTLKVRFTLMVRVANEGESRVAGAGAGARKDVGAVGDEGYGEGYGQR